MKLLKLTFVFCCAILVWSCRPSTKPDTSLEETVSVEEYAEEEEEYDYDDEIEYLESAMEALESKDANMASQYITKAVEVIKGYIDEMDDPEPAREAIKTLTDIASQLSSGKMMTREEFESDLLALDFFNEDDLESDEN